MPATVPHGPVVEGQMAKESHGHAQGVRRHFLGAVVGDVGHPHPALAGSPDVDDVVSDPVAADHAQLGQLGQHLGRDRSVLGQQRRDLSSGLNDILLGATLSFHHLEPGALQDMMLYVYVSIVEIRYEHFQDLITTLSWPIHAWGIISSEALGLSLSITAPSS
jgi:hypothetical protein